MLSPERGFRRKFGAGCAAGLAATAALVPLSSCSRTLGPESEARPLPVAAAPPTDTAPSAPPARATAPPLPARGTGVAVVELFTSEGCSSCPPADRVLSRVAARAEAESLPVYMLSFHVDYWDYLGWRDRFSNAEYSERQRGYASIAKNGGIYTPQVVVNGAAECVGSHGPELDQLIQGALMREPRTRIELQAERVGAGVLVHYRVTGDSQGRVLNLALLEPSAESSVKSGENAGEHLNHVNVVRAFSSRSLATATAGAWSPPLSADFNARPASVVAFAEGAAQRDVSGATALELR